MFNREFESFGGLSAGTVPRSGICPRCPYLDLEPESHLQVRADRGESAQRVCRAWDLRERTRKRRGGNLSAFRVYQWGTDFRSRKQGSPGRIRTYNLSVNSRPLYR
jgi:hypothetical protein